MLEQELFEAVISLTDIEEVRNFLDQDHISSQLRLQLEEEWRKHRPKSALCEPEGESLVDSKSLHTLNTVHCDPPHTQGSQSMASEQKEGSTVVPRTEEPEQNEIPLVFGRYEGRSVLGNGAFGKVYLGYDPQLSRQVAIKVPILKSGDTDARNQFLLEARQLASLKHPGIVSVYDICVEGDQCYIVSDYLEGGSLGDWLKTNRVEWPQAVQIIIKIADSLAHAHANRIVHRDLKPANIIMTTGANPVLVDFGLALSDSSITSSERGVIAGTPSYMSPEQARGEGHRIDGRTDIYSLGVIMYLMLTGRLPFASKKFDELLRQVREDEPQPPRQLNPAIHREVERVCLTAMAKRLRHRYSTAGDMADDLRMILAQTQAAHSVTNAERSSSGSEAIASPPIEFSHTVVKDIGTTLTTSPVLTSPGQRLSTIDDASLESEIDHGSTSVSHGSTSVRHGSSTLRRARDAERRRISIAKFSCDVFTAEDILENLDAEEQGELLHQFQDLCRQVTADFGGTISQLSEDGVRACFGYPLAFEDATQRSVRAGMALIEQIGTLNDRIRRKHKATLSATTVIHSDHAIVQDTGEEGSLSVVGSLLNVVSQMDSMAEPNSVVISDDTFRLVHRFFECEPLGLWKFKGGKQEVHRVKSERAYINRVDAVEPGAMTPLIGRDREVGLLQERWEQATEGMGQVVLLIGDAGLGKSRLVHTLKDYVHPQGGGGSSQGSSHKLSSAGAATIIEWRCSSQYTGSSLYPPIDCLQRLLSFQREDTAPVRLDKLVAHLAEMNLDGNQEIALLASMLSIPLEGRFPALEINPQLQKEKTFELLWDWLSELSAQRPVLFILEDLHWLDPTTLELVEQIVSKGANDRILTLLTFRPEFVTPWKSLAHQTQVALNRLTKRQIGEMMQSKIGGNVPQQVIDQIAERTDGVPLFVEEFTQTIIESNSLSEDSVSGSFRTHEIPATLQDLLIARLDRMAINIEVAQLASAIDREFSYEVIRAVSSLSEQDLQAELQKLVAADLLSERGRLPRTKYTFRHALIQDAAYNSLVKRKRQQIHRDIGNALESLFTETAVTHPEILAGHFSEAGEAAKAIEYWDKAGTRSLALRAFKEAIQQLRSGLQWLQELPESPDRFRHEIKLHTALGVPLQATIGYSAPEVEENYSRARVLCGQLGLTTELFPVLYGMFRYYMLQAKYVQANELAAQLVTLSAQSHATDFVVASNRAMGSPLVYEGKHRQAIPYLQNVVAIPPTLELRAEVYRYDVVDPWIVARSYMSWALWLLGQPEVAQTNSDEAVKIAENLDHSFSLTLALSFSQWIHQFNRDVVRTRATAEKALALAQEHGFAFWYGWCRVMRGWAMAQQGEHAQGIIEIEEGLVAWRAQGSELGSHYYYALLAEACLVAQQFDKAAAALDQAEQFARDTGEGFYAPEIPRLRGELILLQNPAATSDAEAAFAQALTLSREQQARSLELRAACSLARSLHARGQTAEARATLAPVFVSFKEGVDSHDLKEARTFLESLA